MPRKYKVALVKNGVYTNGGVSSVCWFLYQIMSSVKHFDVHLISLETSKNNPINVCLLSPKSWFRGIQIYEYSWRNINVKNVGAYLSEFEFPRYLPRRKLTDLLNQFDLVQVVAGSPAAANVARNINKPICLQMATLTRLERVSMLQKTTFLRKVYGHIMLPIVSRVEKRALNQVDHVFADTDYTREAILPYIDESKISIDTVGVDTQKFHPIPEEQRTNDYILSVGRFADVRKNIELLINAYFIVRQIMPDVPKLILAGKTPPTPDTWSRAEDLRIVNHIEFKKDVSLTELIALYQNAAVFVLSSDEEGLGIVLLEAMACATPVIATRCGGPDSVVTEKTGCLTPVGDAQGMANKLIWMFQNPQQRRIMGQAARQMVESRFSNEVVCKKYLDVYERLLGVRKS